MSSSGSIPAGNPSAYTPLKQPAFALLWTATLVSNIGTWMHEVGAGWLMTTLAPSPAVVTLVQAATTLPIFCFALLAGALADRLDKRRMLISINLLLLAVVGLLTVMVWSEAMTPTLLIAFSLAIGTGAAFMAPAWQAIVPALVPRDQLKPAIALNSMGVNISRAIGPAIAGALIASIGLAAPFAMNTLSFLVILGALVLWRPPAQERHPPTGSLLSEMATGLRHVRHNPAMLATAVRAAAFFLFASAYWALMPLIAREAEAGGSTLYGALMALIGAGAVTSAMLLPRLQRGASPDQTVWIGTAGTGATLLLMAVAQGPAVLLLAAFLGGMSWIPVLTSLNVSAQTALPNWVRARGLAVFLMVFSGSMALGSVVWGQVAAATSVSSALMFAAGGLALGLLATRRLPVGQGEGLDHDPAALWPEAPPVSDEAVDQRAMLTITYRVRPVDVPAFLDRLTPVSHERLRNGATSWHIHQSVEEPELWVETFHVPSWAEHLEHHERVSVADMTLHAALHKLHKGETPPVVRHHVAPRRRPVSR
ncbi:Predicted arabinose efflux permease, MFS family [Palleronia marisminoris]|uniref:Enterobactin exporter EntS n=1 Tax=Palleronia marisminoris TaxID=315423 RepID=A0A1Y5TSZ1_9RHOB|nr:MFS transporter [Palleronia marisminoris]SFH53614.1 Predicted arabinose efflux permease, MFS family [Palleronia marisminoris]SLN71347.1 enterobactin exporter EntS [Palleronia marisminoris]